MTTKRGLRKVRVPKGAIQWFSRGGDVARMGPFATQVEAAAHVMIHESNCGVHRWPYRKCDCTLRPIEGAFVWPEKRR